MFCTHCGSAISGEDSFCRKCGNAQELPAPERATALSARTPFAAAPTVGAPTATARRDRMIPFGVFGFCVGGLVGFAMRPSVLLIGQLPFGVVITRGTNLTGLDLLLRPTAETSFNQMVTAAIVGALIGVVVGLLIKSLSARHG